MEETISLHDIFLTIKKRLAMIVIITLLATAFSAIYTYVFVTPKYDASTQILVNQSNLDPTMQYSQVQTNIQLINTYSVVVKSPVVLDQVIKNLHLNMNSNQLSSLITVDSQQNSQVFSLTVESTSPEKAVAIANAIADSFKSQIRKVMKVNNVSILSKAQTVTSQVPVKPKPTLNMAIAFVVGLMISIGIAFLLEYLDNTVKSEEDVEKLLGLPVLGAVTEMNGSLQKKRNEPLTARKVRGEKVEA